MEKGEIVDQCYKENNLYIMKKEEMGLQEIWLMLRNFSHLSIWALSMFVDSLTFQLCSILSVV